MSLRNETERKIIKVLMDTLEGESVDGFIFVYKDSKDVGIISSIGDPQGIAKILHGMAHSILENTNAYRLHVMDKEGKEMIDVGENPEFKI